MGDFLDNNDFERIHSDYEDLAAAKSQQSLFYLVQETVQPDANYDPIFGQNVDPFTSPAKTAVLIPFNANVVSNSADSDRGTSGFASKRSMVLDVNSRVRASWSAGELVRFNGVDFRIKEVVSKSFGPMSRFLLSVEEVD